MPPLRQRFRTALVTGASAGLGAEFATMLLAEGVEVWGTSRRPEALAPRARFHPVRYELGGGEAAARELVTAVERAAGGIDLLVHNAGYGVFGPFERRAADVWSRQVADLLVASIALTHAVFAAQRGRGRGAIVNVSSIAAELPIPFMSGYNVAKAGLSALSESLVLEARGTGITVIDFRPGDYATGFNDHMLATDFIENHAPARRVWERMLRTTAAAPRPAAAAADLRRALARGRSGTVRSGGFFQAVLAPRLARIAPSSWRRAVLARYFDLR